MVTKLQSRSTLYRNYKKCKANLTRVFGVTDFALMSHGAGEYSVEWMDTTGNTMLTTLAGLYKSKGEI